MNILEYIRKWFITQVWRKGYEAGYKEAKKEQKLVADTVSTFRPGSWVPVKPPASPGTAEAWVNNVGSSTGWQHVSHTHTSSCGYELYVDGEKQDGV